MKIKQLKIAVRTIDTSKRK